MLRRLRSRDAAMPGRNSAKLPVCSGFASKRYRLVEKGGSPKRLLLIGEAVKVSVGALPATTFHCLILCCLKRKLLHKCWVRKYCPRSSTTQGARFSKQPQVNSQKLHQFYLIFSLLTSSPSHKKLTNRLHHARPRPCGLARPRGLRRARRLLLALVHSPRPQIR